MRGDRALPSIRSIASSRGTSWAVERGRRPHVFGVHAGHGYGNAGPVEITKRFPPDLGNLAQNARFPHFHSRLSSVRPEHWRRHAAACRAEARHLTGRWGTLQARSGEGTTQGGKVLKN